MATIKQIAKLAGVSIGTVDRVLHERGGLAPDTKARVQAAIEELGYVPNQTAQSLAVYKKRLHILCFIIESPISPFFHVVNKAIRRKADSLNQAGVRVTLVDMMDLFGAVSGDGWILRTVKKWQHHGCGDPAAGGAGRTGIRPHV